MKLGYAHQSTGALAVAAAVHDLHSGKRPLVTFAIASRNQLYEVVRFAIHLDGTMVAVRFCDGIDPMGPESHSLIPYEDRKLDPVVVAAKMMEALLSIARDHYRADVFRPLDEVDPSHPVTGAFSIVA